MKLLQFELELIFDYVGRWRYLIKDMNFSFPQEELVRLFSKSCVRKISTHLQIQQHRMFEEEISQDKIIEEVMVQNREL